MAQRPYCVDRNDIETHTYETLQWYEMKLHLFLTKRYD